MIKFTLTGYASEEQINDFAEMMNSLEEDKKTFFESYFSQYMKIELKTFKQEIKTGVQKLMYNIVDAVSKNSERVVKQEFTLFENKPIDTGTLRRSITGKVVITEDDQAISEVRASNERALSLIGNKSKKSTIKDMSYAKFVEYGTVKMPARPFMRNGMARARKSNEQIIKQIIK